MDRVFVIIVTYNGLTWLNHCLNSLRNSTIPITTIVVDNASNDGAPDFIRSYFPEIVLIESKANLGFGKGNNIALKYALEHNCNYVFLLNQDAWIEPNTIEQLVFAHHNHPEYGLISPMHLNTAKTGLVMKYFCQQPNNEKLITDLYFNQLSEIYETTYIHAAAWLLPRKTLETVGGFDPIYQHYEEDDDYLNRVRFHKLKIGICPKARIVHDHRSKSSNPFNIKSRYHHEQELLVKLTDLNSSISVFNYAVYFLRKSFVSFLKGKPLIAKEFWRDFVFVVKSKKTVENSRKKNSAASNTWLGT